MNLDALITILAMYLASSYVFLHILHAPPLRTIGFALLNGVFCLYGFFYIGGVVQWKPLETCLAVITLSYVTLQCYLLWPRFYLLALTTPIISLVIIKTGYLPAMIGISYLTFRLSYLVYEIHSGKIHAPDIAGYAGFAFFPLLFLIGPISPYRLYETSLLHPDRMLTPLSRSLGRILVGMVKVMFIAQLFKTMNFNGSWFDGYYHGLSDFAVACACSYLYLYFNFSGACDIIIGAASVINIRVAENFANPLLAHNLREFWNRFHTTLTGFMRDIVFMPGLLWISRILGTRRVHASTAAMLLITFFLIGLWHGVGLNFLMLGLLHGSGMIVFYWYALLWKKFPVFVRQLTDTLPMRWISTLLTFSYVSFTSLFFENDWQKVREIFSLLQL